MPQVQNEAECEAVIRTAVEKIIKKYEGDLLSRYYVDRFRGRWRVTMYLDVHNPKQHQVFELTMYEEYYDTMPRLARFMDEFEQLVVSKMEPIAPEVKLYDLQE